MIEDVVRLAPAARDLVAPVVARTVVTVFADGRVVKAFPLLKAVQEVVAVA